MMKRGCMSIIQPGSWHLGHIHESALVALLNVAGGIRPGSCVLLTHLESFAVVTRPYGVPILF